MKQKCNPFLIIKGFFTTEVFSKFIFIRKFKYSVKFLILFFWIYEIIEFFEESEYVTLKDEKLNK